MAKKCARTFSIVVEKGKKSILEVRHLLPVGIARSVRADSGPPSIISIALNSAEKNCPLPRHFAPKSCMSSANSHAFHVVSL